LNYICWIELELTIVSHLFAARDNRDVGFVFKNSAIACAKDFDKKRLNLKKISGAK